MSHRFAPLLPMLAMTACTRVVAGHPVPAPTPPGAVSTTDTSVAAHRTTPTTATVVSTPADALFDPCGIITWADFPPAVRPAKDERPERMAPNAGAPFTIACNFDNSVIARSTSGPDASEAPASPAGFTPFLATVAWGPAMTPADLQSTETQTTTIDDLPAALRRATTRPKDSEHPSQVCVLIVKLSRGSASVTLTNGRFTSVDACEVVTAVATALVRRVR
jgi:hypothetical protein